MRRDALKVPQLKKGHAQRGADFEVAVGLGHFFGIGETHRLGRTGIDVCGRPSARADGRVEHQHRWSEGTTIAAAGHPPGLIARASGQAEEFGDCGTLLGVFEDPTIPETSTTLRPGDGLTLYTDGLSEAHAPQRTLTAGEMLERLPDINISQLLYAIRKIPTEKNLMFARVLLILNAILCIESAGIFV